MDRIQALERLQNLKDSGSLSEQEFEREKLRVLADATPSNSRYWLLALSGLIFLAAAAWAYFSFDRGVARNPTGSQEKSEQAAESPKSDGESLLSRSAGEQLRLASLAAFGTPAPSILKVPTGSDYGSDDGSIEKIKYTPKKLLWLSFGPVLISEGEVVDAAHVSAGKIAVHYLRDDGDHFTVLRAYPKAVVTGSFGVVGDWSTSDKFIDGTVLYVEGGGTWQGYTCGWATLTALQPSGPTEMVTFPTSYSNEGAVEGANISQSEGKFGKIVKNQSFEVRYHGSQPLLEQYVRRGNAFVLRGGGESKFETC